MSRAYRIRVSESVERIVHVEDGVCATLELLPVLPRERMGQLLAEDLQRRGFVLGEDGTARRPEEAGVVVEVVPSTGVVTVRVTRDQEVKRTIEESTDVDSDAIEAGRAAHQRALRRQLERTLAATEEEMRQQATQALEARLVDLRGEMNTVVNSVTGAALKERAAQLGEIEEVCEDAATGSMTIRVRV